MPFLYSRETIDELERALDLVSEEAVWGLLERVAGARRVFCDGMGRSGLCMRGFAMRLIQLGREAYVVGETVTPAIGPGDLLLICSGSGETPALIQHAGKALEAGAGTALITGKGESSLAKLAGSMVVIPSPSKYTKREEAPGGDGAGASGENRSVLEILPMGTLFEAAAAFLCDNLAAALMRRDGENSESMARRHANLE